MSTSTLIQYLNPTQNTISGGTTPVGASSSNRSQTETFLTETAIVAGEWVQFDLGQTGASKVLVVEPAVAAAVGGTLNALVVGVALDTVTGTATSPATVQVVVSGYVAEANMVIGTNPGNPLGLINGATTGQAAWIPVAVTNGAGPCGVALSAAPAGVGEAWVYKQF